MILDRNQPFKRSIVLYLTPDNVQDAVALQDWRFVGIHFGLAARAPFPIAYEARPGSHRESLKHVFALGIASSEPVGHFSALNAVP